MNSSQAKLKILLTAFSMVMTFNHQVSRAEECCAKPAIDIKSHLDSEIERLRSIEEKNPCRQYAIAALTDPKVRDLLEKRIENPCFQYVDICCLQTIGIPEQARVLFNFDCAPHCVCLVDPQFLVIVDKTDLTVVDIIDPYDGPTQPCISVSGGATGSSSDCADGSCSNAGGTVPCLSDTGCEELGVANYYAIQSGKDVYVFASGVHPMSGFKNCLLPGPEDIHPPILEFKITRPEVGADVVSPFTVCHTFQVETPVRSITLRDAKGQHTVPVRYFPMLTHP